ncbi:MAG: DUF4433 domain-containing protein [bacterium]
MDISNIYIFRITHINNLDYILKLGKITKYSSNESDPNYLGIGERELIQLREDHRITTINSNKIYCPSNDFLPFYFWYKSVMLYRIQTGWKVPQRDSSEIVYLIYKLSDIINDIEYLFTDGHGYATLTQWFDDIQFLNEIDWTTIKETWWKNTEDDSDKERRKQAEFWVKDELSLEKILGIAVFDDESKRLIEQACTKYNRNIEVKVKSNFYYKL